MGVVIERSELHDAAQKAFPRDALKPDRDASWKLAAEMGWLMLPLPEDAGGLGLGRDAAAAIHFELGRVLSRAPLIPAMATVQALGASDTLADKDSWIERATAGEFLTTSLLPGSGSVFADGNAPLPRTIAGVPDADLASHVLVFGGGQLVLAPLADATLAERPLWDESRRLFDVTLGDAAPVVLAEGDAARQIAEQVQIELLFALAAESLGGAGAILELTVDYLKTRKQYDRPLAMFQALKHRCADLRILLGAAEALLWSEAVKPAITLAQAGGLKAHATEVYRYVCEEAMQLHGGVSLTEELYCHLYMKRANLNVQLGGDADRWTEARGREVLAAAE